MAGEAAGVDAVLVIGDMILTVIMADHTVFGIGFVGNALNYFVLIDRFDTLPV